MYSIERGFECALVRGSSLKGRVQEMGLWYQTGSSMLNGLEKLCGGGVRLNKLVA